LIVLLSGFLLSEMTVPALSQYDWEVGVEVGDTFRYVGTIHLWGGTSSFPPIYLEYLQTYYESDWLEYTVMDINAENVTFDVTTHWKNGTETVATMTDNMTSSMSMMVIGASLTEGIEIRAEYTDPTWGIYYATRILNASVMREYESGPKETNVLIYDQNIFGNIFHYEYQWDKETGIRVYSQESTTDSLDMYGDTFTYNVTLELIETNVEDWTVIPEFPTGTVMLLVFIAISVSIELYRRKKLKH
jgi:hypothetical protein